MERKTVKDFIKHTDRNRELNQIAQRIKNGSWKEELEDIINREIFKEDLMIQIKNLIEQELEKARKEGRKEQQKLDCELYGTAVATDEEIKEMWKTKLERMRDKAEKELIKLNK